MIPGEEVHIDLGPDAIKDFKAYLTERSLEFDTMIEDTQALIDNEEVCCSEVNEDNFDKCYHTLDEVENIPFIKHRDRTCSLLQGEYYGVDCDGPATNNPTDDHVTVEVPMTRNPFIQVINHHLKIQ